MVVCSNDNALDLLRAIRAGEPPEIAPAELQSLAQQGLLAVVPARFLDHPCFLDVFKEQLDLQIESLKRALRIRRAVVVLGPLIYPDEPTSVEAEISTYAGIASNLPSYPNELEHYSEVGNLAVAVTRKGRRLLGEEISDSWEEQNLPTGDWRKLGPEAQALCDVLRAEAGKIFAEFFEARDRFVGGSVVRLKGLVDAAKQAANQLSVLGYSISNRPMDWHPKPFSTNFPELLKALEQEVEVLAEFLQEMRQPENSKQFSKQDLKFALSLFEYRLAKVDLHIAKNVGFVFA